MPVPVVARLAPAPITVLPGPVIVAAFHVLPGPVSVSVPVPPSVAALKLRSGVLVPSELLKFEVPPVSAIELTFITVLALKFAVPELTLSAPLFVYDPVCVNAAPLTLTAPAPASVPPTL